jgi:hypothetical protein
MADEEIFDKVEDIFASVQINLRDPTPKPTVEESLPPVPVKEKYSHFKHRKKEALEPEVVQDEEFVDIFDKSKYYLDRGGNLRSRKDNSTVKTKFEIAKITRSHDLNINIAADRLRKTIEAEFGGPGLPMVIQDLKGMLRKKTTKTSEKIAIAKLISEYYAGRPKESKEEVKTTTTTVEKRTANFIKLIDGGKV